MIKRLKLHRPSHTTVVAYLSLFLVVSGGAALAASQLHKNSVGAKQIKKNAVTTAKIKNGAVTGAKINLSSLGTVPNATHATSADTAGSATTAGNAATAERALNVMAASVSAAGVLTAATVPGTAAAKFGGNTYTVTFPRSVQGCVPVASTGFVTGGEVSASNSGTANPNRVDLFTTNGNQDFNLTVTC
jgi:hypothetical protein